MTKDYEDEAFDELEKSLQRKVAHGVTDGSKVTIDRTKLEQVLEGIEAEIAIDWECNSYHPKIYQAVTILKEALEDV